VSSVKSLIQGYLTLTQDEAEKIVTDFIADVRTFLMNRGISL